MAITHIVDLNTIGQTPLWREYSAINYGQAVPEKGYTGFKSFVEDVTNADRVEGRPVGDFILHFEDEAKYTWFLLRWT